MLHKKAASVPFIHYPSFPLWNDPLSTILGSFRCLLLSCAVVKYISCFFSGRFSAWFPHGIRLTAWDPLSPQRVEVRDMGHPTHIPNSHPSPAVSHSILTANAAFSWTFPSGFWGWPCSQILGHTWTVLVPEDPLPFLCPQNISCHPLWHSQMSVGCPVLTASLPPGKSCFDEKCREQELPQATWMQMDPATVCCHFPQTVGRSFCLWAPGTLHQNHQMLWHLVLCKC